MKRFRDNTFSKISKAVTIAYLSTAILWGASCCTFAVERAFVRSDYESGGLSKERYMDYCRSASKREEIVLKTIAVGFGVTFVADISLSAAEVGKE